jgi:hypothetical protein
MMRTFILALSFVLVPFHADAANRRALLVGINDYTASRLPRRATSIERDWPNLAGSVNDVTAMKEMLVRLYDFEERDVVTLTDQGATRQAILMALRDHLATPAAKGDVLLFYFAGHGSQVRNTLSDERDRLDESLVPADSRRGAPDIRDKELRPLFNRVLDRGARLSVILDNCHSGSGARGLDTGARPRGIQPDLRDVADRANYGPRPEDRGALVLAATQDDDAAWEMIDEHKRMHGAFSWAWIRAMRDSFDGESASETFTRAAARMRAERPYQQPVLAGNDDVLFTPFLGARSDRRAGRTVIPVEKLLPDGTVILDGGWANGLAIGSELRVWNDRGSTARITITAIHGLSRSEGRIPARTPMPPAIRSGALMEVVGWTASVGRPMRIWTPTVTANIDTLAILAQRMSAAATRRGVRWIDDPIEATPTHLLRHTQQGWELLGPKHSLRVLGNPGADAIAAIATIPAKSSLFVQFPAPAALIGNIDRDDIEIIDRAENADYILSGRYANRRLSYAWVRPSMRAADRRKSGLPLRSTWLTDRGLSASALRDAVVRLRRIHAWSTLESPPEARFEYGLELRRVRDGARPQDGALRGKEQYALFLRATKSLRSVPPRFLYVFTVDNHGRSFLLFGTSSVENHFPAPDTTPPQELSLGLTSRFEIAPPYGIDTYFLLTTDEPLPNPSILQWDGVQGDRAPHNALEELLIRTADGSRAPRRAIASTWSIERLFYESVPPPNPGNSRPRPHKSRRSVSFSPISSPLGSVRQAFTSHSHRVSPAAEEVSNHARSEKTALAPGAVGAAPDDWSGAGRSHPLRAEID